MALAKALGGGFPIGACLATAEAGKGMTAGTHGSTFGGNPLATRVGNAVLDVVLAPGFLEHTRRMSLLLKQRLAELKDRFPSVIADVRGEGLLLGLVCVVPNTEMVDGTPQRKDAGDRGRRQCRAAVAAADHRRGRHRRRHRHDRTRLRKALPCGEACQPGCSLMAKRSIRHFIDLIDIRPADLRAIIAAARAMKKARGRGKRPLSGQTLAMIFDKPSTRTRISFEVAMKQLGGDVVTLTGQEMQLGRGESIPDTARVMSRFVDAVVIRTLEHDLVTELAQYATVPIINALTKQSHPCQVMADVMTFEEHLGSIKNKTVAWTGDANNVLTSWMHAAERFDFRLNVATPPELKPQQWLLDWIADSGAAIHVGTDPEEAVRGAHCVVTDTWVSMGDEASKANRHNLLQPYQVNARLMAKAKPDAIFMHCLPAHRGEEVTDEVMDGPQSVVFDEAENRLHAQKGILTWCLNASAR